MEMERLNENTIRVTLGSEDLAARGITMLDLLGNHKQIEEFFYEILDEVDTDHSFADNSAVTFQVMPSQSGLELLISKSLQGEADEDDEQVAPAKSVPEFIRQQLNAFDDDDTDAVDEGGFIDENGSARDVYALKFDDIEDFIHLADNLRLEGAASDLYRYHDSYYLVLTFYANQVAPDEVRDQVAIALEYGQRTTVTPGILAEHGQSIIATSALETARYYFK